MLIKKKTGILIFENSCLETEVSVHQLPSQPQHTENLITCGDADCRYHALCGELPADSDPGANVSMGHAAIVSIPIHYPGDNSNSHSGSNDLRHQAQLLQEGVEQEPHLRLICRMLRR
jgi:hypothetical protein